MDPATSAPDHREIERKFKVLHDGWRAQVEGEPITMRAGYLSRRPEATIRIRFEGDDAVLTIKGMAIDTDGRERPEHNFHIPVDQAEAILAGPMVDGSIVRKVRYPVRVGQSLYTVDVFDYPRPGLVLAEIELPDRHASFERSDWLGEEVTSDWTYSNAAIAAD